MNHSSLSAWLAWLEQSHPREIDLGLERVHTVATRMGLLTPDALIVTVAGTNGKGSCVATTATLLAAAGHRVGVYTSPHLLDYNERIQINGLMASDQEICAAFQDIYDASQRADEAAISLTYFEYGTLAALEVFRQRGVSAMVLEVGLGGRLDAVNIIDADVAVITSIALDHTDWLGDTREVIALEKVGVARTGKPLVCADFAPPCTLLDKAVELQSPLSLIGRDFGYNDTVDRWDWWAGDQLFSNQPLPQLPLPSVAAGLRVAQLLGLDLAELDAFALVADLRVTGRFQQLIWRDRQLILDVAHNPAATEYLTSRLIQQKPLGARVHALVAMMEDKDRLQSLSNLKRVVNSWYLVALTDVPRAASPEQMRQNLADLALEPLGIGSLVECLEQAYQASESGDYLLVLGSFFTVAACLSYLKTQMPDVAGV